MATVHHWTGREARALRLALRMTVRGFAEHLGVGVRTVSKWEQLLTATEPRPESQAILDTALARAEAAVHLRLETSLSRAGGDAAGPRRRTTVARPLAWEYESWTDDLDRVVVSLSRQDFPLADDLLHRWLGAFSPLNLDQRGLYLYARSTTLLLALLNEMSWNLDAARGQYERLADDERLSRRDRARSRLWMGRALSKAGDYEPAIAPMAHAAHEFEDLGEPDHWSVAQQKIALALRGCGDLTRAFRHIEVARSVGGGDSPLQRVRLSTAHAQILLSDPATRDEGRSVLHGAARVADAYGLGHQLTSIENIRRTGGESPTARARESAG
ncbi:helix-turn-helix domain-containing protein [Actinacidiphila bryophytorum]|uniref:helix-turn-helix domain-containing protein n=1 Tax=Actinacidiphila bryophytorum TaxID=1436133 RepID=UPI002176E416|nr:hypothetical protein [Actinacidiphila bryophytorum]UWE12959.1 hypothetical protein NYE86_32640 [Actinacidiphila bryophytorum]